MKAHCLCEYNVYTASDVCTSPTVFLKHEYFTYFRLNTIIVCDGTTFCGEEEGRGLSSTVLNA